jgi:ATP synthase F1 complex assembly factor 2
MHPSTRLLASIPRASTAASSLSARRTTRLAYTSYQSASYAQSRNIHNSTPNSATPLHHPTVPGPPPGPPQQPNTETQERLARKRQQAESFLEGVNSRPSAGKPTSLLKKRFWKDVSVKETPSGLEVYLDSRAVKTAAKESLILPHSKRSLASAIALEWDQLSSAQQALKNSYVPLTSGASRAMDIVAEDAAGQSDPIRASIVAMAMRYLSTDTLLCWAPEKNIHDPVNETRKPLRQRQREVAEPIIGYLQSHVFPGCEINPILSPDSIVPIPQPQATRDVIKSWVQGLPAFELAGLERGILATKSLLVAARMVAEWGQMFAATRKAGSERFGIEHATEAASLEVLHQTEQWGEVEDTHDVDNADIRRQLGTVVLLVS